MTIRTHDGLSLTFEESGDGPVSALFAHANGFCKELWHPVIGLVGGVRAITVDQRGHGDSEVGSGPFDWWDNARDQLAVVDQLEVGHPRIGIGHSSGAAFLAMSEIVRPGTWDALVLVEQITPPPPFARADGHPLVQSALRRKRSFADAATAHDSYRGRGPFRLWSDESLRLYVHHGFRDERGERVLACHPEVEAEFYRSATAHGAWDRLDEVGCPVTIVVGEHSDTHAPPYPGVLASRFPNATMVSVPEATHFVPMEHPDVVAAAVRDVAQSLIDT